MQIHFHSPQLCIGISSSQQSHKRWNQCTLRQHTEDVLWSCLYLIKFSSCLNGLCQPQAWVMIETVSVGELGKFNLTAQVVQVWGKDYNWKSLSILLWRSDNLPFGDMIGIKPKLINWTKKPIIYTGIIVKAEGILGGHFAVASLFKQLGVWKKKKFTLSCSVWIFLYDFCK